MTPFRETLYKIAPTDSTEPYFATINSILCLKHNTAPNIAKDKTGKSERYRIKYHESFIEENYTYSLAKLKDKSLSYTYCDTTKDAMYKKAKKEHDRLTLLYYNSFPLHELEMINYINQKQTFKHRKVLYRTGITFNNPLIQELSPYLLGAWIGDDASRDPDITNIDPELIDYFYEEASRMNMKVERGDYIDKDGKRSITYYFRPIILDLLLKKMELIFLKIS